MLPVPSMVTPATGGMPRPMGACMFISCGLGVWFCCRLVGLLCWCCDFDVEVLVPHPGASFWIPSALFCDAGIRLWWCVGLAVSSVPAYCCRTGFVAVSGAWGIDHVSVGCVPHRATGVRPERPAGAGGSSLACECAVCIGAPGFE